MLTAEIFELLKFQRYRKIHRNERSGRRRREAGAETLTMPVTGQIAK